MNDVNAEVTAPTAAVAAGLPSIAVVIPCWNAEKWVARAIQSVLDQNYPSLEVIVIDDGSTDGSLEVIKSFGGKIRWETGPNRGAPAVRNRGAELTQSECLYFLDVDDYIEPGYLSGLAEAMMSKNAEIVLGPFLIQSTDGARSPKRTFKSNATAAELINATVDFKGAQTGAILLKRSLFEKIGGWNTQLGRLQDYFLGVKALTRCRRHGVSEVSTLVYCDHKCDYRITQQRAVNTEISVLVAYQEAIETFEKILSNDAKMALANQVYCLAVELFRWGKREEAQTGFALARQLGLRGHGGNFRHRVLCAVLGLPLKEKIGALVRTALHQERRQI